ncbi:methylmalonyl Co-A mutase-associated GTPase MeaB [Pareuzebyella sediminis]|uniref:methylmalonyl Co-A mutase-associated GTPase MeaB n=1 Tax=Pareuzebyella sediminis TaxID=2607998 RepID=UPI0011EED725|nr:methylmalonyl Co-A mutase-associated GTPase MeaB [Pareuzebyella sediminis]
MAINKNSPFVGRLNAKRNRKNEPVVDDLISGIFRGDKVALARSLTLIESTLPEHFKKAEEIVERCLESKTDSIRIGITGVPGVGKSTFIETLGTLLASQGHKIAVLAVDPTSKRSKGSILGDKTRMETLSKNERVFIRPSPSGQTLGGVARKTRESIILCEAAGYSIILVETVGVGQSETTVHGMVDFFLLLILAGAGDELQGIKRGIFEMADAIAVNKADGTNLKNARIAEIEVSKAMHLYPPKKNGWRPKVLHISAIEDIGVKKIWKIISDYTIAQKLSGSFLEKRKQQNRDWFFESLENQLKSDFYTHKIIQEALEPFVQKVVANEISPFSAARQLIALIKAVPNSRKS